MGVLSTIYVVGVAIGLFGADARPAVRLALALLWPAGPVAFVATLALLVIAAMIAFPVFGALVLAGAAAGWVVLWMS